MADASASQGSSGVNYTIGVTFSLPLSDGGQRRSDLDKAKALQERAKAETMQAEQRISKEVRQVWLDVETAKQSYETSRTALEAAQSAYEITALRVQNQKAILVEQLDALASMTQTRTNLAVSLYEYEIAVAKLLRLSGYNNP